MKARLSSANYIHNNKWIFPVPSGPPQNFTISVTPHNLTLSWSPPLPSQQNGVITSYVLTCSSGGSIINSTRTSSLTKRVQITSLVPGTQYTCFVNASTVVGDGPAAVRSVVTKEKSESIHNLR